ncbi:MAG: hypothetical protein FE78DRAFT_136826 [Acidomyces sp. 'richmondensis']|nr:MAG: hypothetical protein FE78DRAFT_136826 [Acidomyces sp. 'richmondensis']
MSPHAIHTTSPGHLSNATLLQKFDVTNNGFLPATLPLQRLPHASYDPWESLICNLPIHLRQDTLRTEVGRLEVIPTDHLKSQAEYRRAYVILAFLAQAYIWGGDVPNEQVLPPAISVPFLAISKKLELPPVLTYAACNLWNFSSATEDFSDLENIHALHTFTGTRDESWFYMISVAMEAKAGCIIPTMLRAVEAANVKDYPVIIQALEAMETCIRDIGALLDRMHEKCDPIIFFNHIRPFLAGSKNMAGAGLPRGVFYDEGDGRGDWLQLRGGSNGQSSLIQFLDIVLGVIHTKQGSNNPIQDQNQASDNPELTFHDEIQAYMPGSHQRFLQHVKKMARVRQLASVESETVEQELLRKQYSATVEALGEFRNKHIQIVTRYILLPSKESSERKRQNLASASTDSRGRPEELTGTGGTMLMPFLKQVRNETLEAALIDRLTL